MQELKLWLRASTSALVPWWLFISSSTDDTSLHRHGSGGLRRPQEDSGGLRRPQEDSGGLRRTQEAAGRPGLGLPGILLGLDKPDHVVHPQQEVSDHAEEPELVSGVEEAEPASVAGLQQTPPGLQHLALPPLDVVGFVSGIRRLQADRVLLQLPHLHMGSEVGGQRSEVGRRAPPVGSGRDPVAPGLDVVFEGAVHPLQRVHRVLVAARLLRQLLLLVQHAAQDLLGVLVEPVELEGGGEDLRPGVDELQQVGPGLVQPVLPLRHRGRVAVAGVDQLVRQAVDGVHALLTDVPGVPSKLTETLLQHLNTGVRGQGSWDPATTSRSAIHCSRSSTSRFSWKRRSLSSSEHTPLGVPVGHQASAGLGQLVDRLGVVLHRLLHDLVLLLHGLGLGGVEVVLLGFVRLLQPAVPKLRLLRQPPPQLLQVGLAPPGLVLQEALAALQDAVDTRLVALDLLLQGLKRRRQQI
ncbi:hypothetical protein EYF80_044969 [Liparis tanakae]|uniref:Uncharacterized protein n=1 Tax=Liparis tanakae TaxID=230148 RepID=A0A4Z2FVB5_9TELE|nr:hypothetical protein EYF80_044969 [Liparis tanakae]